MIMAFLRETPELLFYGGLIICGIAAFWGVVTAIALRISKSRLIKQLDSEFGGKSEQ